MRRRPPETKTCAYTKCGVVFQTTDRRLKYHNTVCGSKERERRKSLTLAGRLRKNALARARYKPKRPQEMSKTCGYKPCGKEFITTDYRRKYHDPVCAIAEWECRAKKRRGGKDRVKTEKPYQRTCDYEFCDNEFHTNVKTKKYCHDTCGERNRALRRRRLEGESIKPIKPKYTHEQSPDAAFNELWLCKELSRNPNPLVVTYRS